MVSTCESDPTLASWSMLMSGRRGRGALVEMREALVQAGVIRLMMPVALALSEGGEIRPSNSPPTDSEQGDPP